MLSDKKGSSNNSGTIVLFLLMAVFMGINFFLGDPAKEKLAQDEAQTKVQDSSVIQTAVAPTDASNEVTSADSGTVTEYHRQQYGTFAKAHVNQNQTIKVETPLAIYEFNSLGAKLSQVTLKKYTAYAPKGKERKPVQFFKDGHNDFDFFLEEGITKYRTSKLPYEVGSTHLEVLSENESTQVIFKIDGDYGEQISHIYTLQGDSYYLDYNVSITGFSGLPNQIPVLWNTDLNRQEKGLSNERKYAAIYFREMETEETDDVGENVIADSEDDFDEVMDWVAHKQQFFTSAMIYSPGFKATSLGILSTEEDSSKMMNMQSALVFDASNNGANYQFKVYHGPNEYDQLDASEVDLEEVIPYTWGIFGIFNKYFTHNILSFLTMFISNYGLIIIIIAICVKLLVSPFTYKTYLSSLKMKVLKPELTALREKYKDDNQTLQMEQMKFYRQAGVNPLGGCIPLLFQMPILFAMFRFFPSAIEMRGKSFLWADDLASYDAILTWTTDIPVVNWIFDNHLSLFTLLMSLTTLITTRMSSNQMPDQGNPAMAQQMKIMQIAMPVIFIPVFNSFAAALSCYYFVMNVLTIVQQFLMKRFLIDEDKIHAKIQLKQSQPKKKSKFQRKLDEILEQQEQMKKNNK